MVKVRRFVSLVKMHKWWPRNYMWFEGSITRSGALLQDRGPQAPELNYNNTQNRPEERRWLFQ